MTTTMETAAKIIDIACSDLKDSSLPLDIRIEYAVGQCTLLTDILNAHRKEDVLLTVLGEGYLKIRDVALEEAHEASPRLSYLVTNCNMGAYICKC